MANGFGSLYVGASGLQGAQNAMNVVSNNLANVTTKGYVRQKVIFADRHYNKFQTAAVSDQYNGTGVVIGQVTHIRNVFLDKAYRTQSGKAAFYAAGYDATSEVETQLQESDGQAFNEAVTDLYKAFAEFAKDPSDTANQNLVIQKSELFLSRANGVYDGLKKYQVTIDTKINNDVARINELGKEIVKLNNDIQRIESGGTETAKDLRDQRDLDLDELGKLASITYEENQDHIVTVKLEGTEFVNVDRYNELSIHDDPVTGYATPYWLNLSEPENGIYYDAFDPQNADPGLGTDVGEVKSLLLLRGDHVGTYLDLKDLNLQQINGEYQDLSSEQYDNGVANSIVMNSEAELDKLIHTIVTKVNNLVSPTESFSNVDGYKAYASQVANLKDASGKVISLQDAGLTSSTRVLDIDNADYGSDNMLPSRELFVRSGTERYTAYTMLDSAGNPLKKENGDPVMVYIYNEEKASDLSTCYTTGSLHINEDLMSNESHLPYKKENGDIDYQMAEKLNDLWETSSYVLNPSDVTPTTLTGFYTKFIGELGTTGSVYKTTSETLTATKNSIDESRQGVIGVSSDEELTNMIRYQNAYNASSRYMNVISEMIEHLITSLGHA
ncbi:MAG TPA: flagellar hook-associated protein FlgK [Lachnospiraceae bacterium]|jgi:flagellar hook-associated protein 1 FlgK|nr:flagellar hook-associated protein FlgK [Lachnospiraceae bacterium]HBE08866.1 flagellar hook-associated protein FlgK [Lachnospiraceae bacterium]